MPIKDSSIQVRQLTVQMGLSFDCSPVQMGQLSVVNMLHAGRTVTAIQNAVSSLLTGEIHEHLVQCGLTDRVVLQIECRLCGVQNCEDFREQNIVRRQAELQHVVMVGLYEREKTVRCWNEFVLYDQKEGRRE